MGVMSIRVNDDKRKLLKVIASAEGKTISGIVEELIEGYIEKNKTSVLKLAKKDENYELMKLSEQAFGEDWNNKADDIYDKL